MQNKLDNEWQIDTLPNRLTIFRISLIPILVVSLGAGFIEHDRITPIQETLEWVSVLVFMVASFTDFLDGHIARRNKQVTVFGSFLDPIADKFLVVSSLLLLQGLGRINTIVVIVLILREMYMTSLRLLANERGVKVPVNNLGKWKTAIQMMSIPCLMLNKTVLYIPLDLVGLVLISVATFLSVFSASLYSVGLVKKFAALKKEQKNNSSVEQN